jgi:uncharacterized protein YaaN involved in tellurite resistance
MDKEEFSKIVTLVYIGDHVSSLQQCKATLYLLYIKNKKQIKELRKQKRFIENTLIELEKEIQFTENKKDFTSRQDEKDG